MRGAYKGYKVTLEPSISRIFRDFELCETFGWDLYKLYSQPRVKILGFEIILDERNKIKEDERKKQEMENHRRG